MLTYLSETPVADLESWFSQILKLAFPEKIFFVLGPSTESELIPESHIRINYKSYSSNSSAKETVLRQSFDFEISYYSSGPSDLHPHHDALAMMEKGRFSLWQKTPPRPANSGPLILRSEKLNEPPENCGCKFSYSQIWSCSNLVNQEIVDFPFDPCISAGEPNVLIPVPIDFIKAFNSDWYYCLNSKYDSLQPFSIGENQPWTIDTSGTAEPARNPNFNDQKPTIWGNIPIILCSYFKKLQLVITPEEIRS